MILESLGEIVAKREYTLVRDGTPAEKYQVLMGKPLQIPNHTDYSCPYQIKGKNLDKIRGICGLDSFQAMQLTLNVIGVELEVIERDSGGTLIWDGNDGGDLGFPKPDWKSK